MVQSDGIAQVASARPPWTEARGDDPSGKPLTLTPEETERYTGLVETYFDAVWRTLRGLGVPHAHADDAAQQVFLVALKKLGQIASGSERAFLLGTAVGIASNARRGLSRRREVADPDVVDFGADPRPDPEQAALISERRALVQRVLDGMPEDLRIVFVLFELEGVTSIEIAHMLDLPVGTVSSRLRRAREHFQTKLQRTIGERP